jgi:hypothetical protein
MSGLDAAWTQIQTRHGERVAENVPGFFAILSGARNLSAVFAAKKEREILRSAPNDNIN